MPTPLAATSRRPTAHGKGTTDHNTYGDHSEDYYTPWVCDADYPGLDKWYTKTVELRAVSWSGQQGSPHDHQSYQAEINPC
jgi:hypothetical protein